MCTRAIHGRIKLNGTLGWNYDVKTRRRIVAVQRAERTFILEEEEEEEKEHATIATKTLTAVLQLFDPA